MPPASSRPDAPASLKTGAPASSKSDAPGGRPTPAPAVTLGYVSRPNGLLGAVVIHTDPSMFDVLVKGLEVELHPRKGNALRTRIRSAAPVRGGMRVSFDRVTDRDQSEALVGATVHVEREQLGALKDGEYLDTDLVGLEVVAKDGTVIGRLVEVIATGANDVYVVVGADKSEIMVPAVAHAVVGVDLASGRMTVDGDALEYGAPPAASATPEGEPAATRPKAFAKPPRTPKTPTKLPE